MKTAAALESDIEDFEMGELFDRAGRELKEEDERADFDEAVRIEKKKLLAKQNLWKQRYRSFPWKLIPKTFRRKLY